MTILYVFTFPILQEVINKSIDYQVLKFKDHLIEANRNNILNATQIQILSEKYKDALISAYGVNQPTIDKYFIQMYNLLHFNSLANSFINLLHPL